MLHFYTESVPKGTYEFFFAQDVLQRSNNAKVVMHYSVKGEDIVGGVWMNHATFKGWKILGTGASDSIITRKMLEYRKDMGYYEGCVRIQDFGLPYSVILIKDETVTHDTKRVNSLAGSYVVKENKRALGYFTRNGAVTEIKFYPNGNYHSCVNLKNGVER